MNSKRLKVYTAYQAGSYKMMPVPEIRLKGKWLKEIGFEEGNTIKVQQRKNKITITLDRQK